MFVDCKLSRSCTLPSLQWKAEAVYDFFGFYVTYRYIIVYIFSFYSWSLYKYCKCLGDMLFLYQKPQMPLNGKCLF
jgi:hypothetical protein